VPGGPASRMPLGMREPDARYFSGFLKKSTTCEKRRRGSVRPMAAVACARRHWKLDDLWVVCEGSVNSVLVKSRGFCSPALVEQDELCSRHRRRASSPRSEGE